LNLSKITAHIPAILDIKIDGNLKNSLDINSMSFDLNVDKLSSSSSKLNTILNTDIIPRELDALGNISLVGKFKGDLSSFDVRDMTLNTSAKTQKIHQR